MQAPRPTFIDLRSKSSDSVNHTGVPSPRALPSPRMQHFAGDIPPAMSPLDMFAAQSRMLAKRLEDSSQRSGRRVSRLPPLSTADPITKQKSIYQRSHSTEATGVDPGSSPRHKEDDMGGTVPEVEEPQFRPKSFYPRMSNVPPVEDDDDEGGLIGLSPEDQPFVTPAEFQPARTNDYFGNSQSKSPDEMVPIGRNMEPPRNPWIRAPRIPEPPHPYHEAAREMSLESNSSGGHSSSLAPPRSPYVRQAPSIRSIPQDSSDDEHSASTGGSDFSNQRKLSSSSGVSMPASPLAPFAQGHGRSPSLNSEISIGGSRQQRAAFNFSRPISRGSQPSVDLPGQPSFDSRPSMDAIRPSLSSRSRQPSQDSQRFLFVDDTVQTPVSTDNEQLPTGADPKDAPAPSYIYAKFSLPRGREVERDSEVLLSKDMPHFEYDSPTIKTNVTNVRPTTPLGDRKIPPPNLSPMRSPKPSTEIQRASPNPSLEQRLRQSPRPSFEQRIRHSPRPSVEQRPWESPRPSNERPLRESPRPSFEQRSRSPARPSAEQGLKVSFRPSFEQTRAAAISRPAPTPVVEDNESEYTASTRSASTIKARPRKPDSMELSAEEHLAKGIALHERGEARESTYHLRIAAKQNSPTAMLLYALACRHGWGMRPNQHEGVQWLRKAADCASLEIAIDEDQGDVLERKTRRAQFALSIYELGVSHMNGWGIEQDKMLALRCFEIAANWGDADAMAEAGFCYAQGQGCKKDLKRAAKYYRMAEAKGMSMVGNSWYVLPDSRPARAKFANGTFAGFTNPSTRTTPAVLPVMSERVAEQQSKPRLRRNPGINRGRERYLGGKSLSRVTPSGVTVSYISFQYSPTLWALLPCSCWAVVCHRMFCFQERRDIRFS